ncbi:hypothetical protein [Arthrobacter sp. NicSoilB11]|uniref:hypothetical protein n=1 Tax=Arthrobacter sp. NicSoilB11 TaxID=2830999 RepID=UPI001CC53C61|nr:hypothetical protein [Arthrobacter sp. NicSoilB11]BCW76259.1 hypothetical protein NicSoilB11_25840 [Arthrobacter sp. NicSoilB11]
MSQGPEDLFSPEEEAQIQRDAIRNKINDDLDIFEQTLDAIRENPENVGPGVHEAMQEAVTLYKGWMKQQGIGMPQPDVDI